MMQELQLLKQIDAIVTRFVPMSYRVQGSGEVTALDIVEYEREMFAQVTIGRDGHPLQLRTIMPVDDVEALHLEKGNRVAIIERDLLAPLWQSLSFHTDLFIGDAALLQQGNLSEANLAMALLVHEPQEKE